MKVAIVQEHVSVSRGGAETSTVEMARHLAALGLDITVLSRGRSDQPTLRDNVTYQPVPDRGWSKADRTYRFVQRVQRYCHLANFDLVHAVSPCLAADVYQPRGGTYAETIARSLARTTPPWRWVKHFGRRFNVRQRFLFRLERLLLGKYAARVTVAAVSYYVQQQVTSQYQFPRDQTRVVFNGVDVRPVNDEEIAAHRAAVRERFSIVADGAIALFVAHNFKLKGLAELLRALAAPESPPDVTLVVAGRDEPDPYARLARQLRIVERVRFVGPDTPVRDLYAASDVLAHPTWYDPCSRVVLEALSLGLPVITTRHNGAAEVMAPGTHGVVIDSAGDIVGLARALQTALAPDLRAACRASAPHMHAQLSMARHARELKALYEEVLAARRG
jgi:UDP-glucose:(heptosyl)LPS alpha-1,3-glucosyltransferase